MDRLLTCADVARLLNVVPDTVRDLERRGRIKAIRTPGGIRLFREADVKRFAQMRDDARRKTYRPAPTE
jgi:excisionase family DNA binding protein